MSMPIFVPFGHIEEAQTEEVSHMNNPREKGCLCHGCGIRYRVDFNIPNIMWERIRQPHENLLCGQCITKRIEAIGEYDYFELTKNDLPHLFQLGEFTLHSGEKSFYKIDCDALTDDDMDAIAFLLSKRLPPFGNVIGVPRGGLRLAKALQEYCHADSSLILIVDDVYTTGNSMEEARTEHSGDVVGSVIFARRPVPHWIVPLFTLTPTAQDE